MDQVLKEKTIGKPRILLAPLDWGLGHATRCIPIIRQLQQQGCEVLVAAEGRQAILLQQEFPELMILPLKGYHIKYAGSAIGLFLSVFFQVPKILRSIRCEHAWLLSIVNEYDIDAVISDNRYGLYHKKIPCIFITHQLTIRNPLGRWAENILQKRNYKFINRFTACWVPDEEAEKNLAGELSHPVKKPAVPVHYIGPLSRLVKSNVQEEKGHLLICLSGPEPQRTLLENKMIKEIAHYNGTATVIRGLPGTASVIPSSNMIRFYNHLPAHELSDEMMKAEYVIGRSGYSSIMDLLTLQKKSILIPTPGQTEQEYLAAYLSKRKIVFSVQQKGFSLRTALEKARQFHYQLTPENNNETLKQVIAAFVAGLSQ
mgnify:CR=1 FL=1